MFYTAEKHLRASASPREIITQTAQAILAAYGLAPDTPEPEIVAHLFKFYAEQSGQEG